MTNFFENFYQQLTKPKAFIWITVILIIFSLWVTLRDKYLVSTKSKLEKGDEMLKQGRWNDAFYWYHLVDSTDVLYPNVLKKQRLVDSIKNTEKK
ncbi:MAG: hypothetical protein A3H98_05775 [Bacteroidetes bacterium RIFCSPLOWO2_02_FULL_36_8]|nr:MAG: hypothetical protein A3H98_05775 [Bacteroidetes bacterium RIFCSPLOWO2_02_FULL_36_8]OFY70107.1 MAG: hypothetical protein A3G23_11760 [Bacteroidetes bacterium RIFCSPLOWO2_12_FULL_37_12]